MSFMNKKSWTLSSHHQTWHKKMGKLLHAQLFSSIAGKSHRKSRRNDGAFNDKNIQNPWSKSWFSWPDGTNLGLKMDPQMPWMNLSCIFPRKIAILRFLFFSVFIFRPRSVYQTYPRENDSSLNWSVGKAAFCDQKPPASRLPEKRWVQPEFPALSD